jgi:hypothetical protein
MWIYLLIWVTGIYALYKERQALGCPDIPNGEDCDNANGKAVKGTRPSPTDPTPVVFDKIRTAADFADKWVVWRIAFLLSIPCVLLIYFFLYQRLAKEQELMVGIFVIASVVYFVLNFYKFHLINYARNNIDEGLKILETR